MKAPKVTVALMVYNEAAHVRAAIESIRGQSFSDYELLVGDNCSTDGSSGIVKEMAQHEPRIRHVVHERNIGALQNWNELVRNARGEYFVLAGGHDLWTSDYLEKLVAELDRNLQAVLAFAKTQWIDAQGRDLDIPTDIVDTSRLSRVARFLALTFANQHYLYGLIRLEALRATRLQREILGSGEILLQELASFGAFALVEGPRWFRRHDRAPETARQHRARYARALFSSAATRRRFRWFPGLQMFAVYLTLPFTVKSAGLWERVGMVATVPYLLHRFAPLLVADVKCLFGTNRPDST